MTFTPLTNADHLVAPTLNNLLTEFEANLSGAGGVSQFLTLPGLVGFWPMSALGASGQANDLSRNDLHLTYNGNPVYKHNGQVAYIAMDGTGDYMSRADEALFDITGGETNVETPGLTLGGWFRANSVALAQGLIGKYGAAGQQSYLLYLAVDGTVRGIVSGDGTNLVTVTGPTVEAGQWFYATIRFKPSTSADINVDDNAKVSATASIPATLFNSTAPFEIGRHNSTWNLNGDAALCFLCASYLDDDLVASLYEGSKGLFG